jgi:hypothetical protein
VPQSRELIFQRLRCDVPGLLVESVKFSDTWPRTKATILRSPWPDPLRPYIRSPPKVVASDKCGLPHGGHPGCCLPTGGATRWRLPRLSTLDLDPATGRCGGQPGKATAYPRRARRWSLLDGGSCGCPPSLLPHTALRRGLPCGFSRAMRALRASRPLNAVPEG